MSDMINVMFCNRVIDKTVDTAIIISTVCFVHIMVYTIVQKHINLLLTNQIGVFMSTE